MGYRILTNKEGKFKVQSRSWFGLDFGLWSDRGHIPHADLRSLNWKATEYTTVEEAREFLEKCRTYDISIIREREWSLVEETT